MNALFLNIFKVHNLEKKFKYFNVTHTYAYTVHTRRYYHCTICFKNGKNEDKQTLYDQANRKKKNCLTAEIWYPYKSHILVVMTYLESNLMSLLCS